MSHGLFKYKGELDELGGFVNRGARGLRRLTPDEVRRFDVLHRRACVLLAQVRTRMDDPALVEHLSGLVARSHALLYTSVRPRNEGAARLWAVGFAGAVVRTRRFHLVAAGLFLMGMVAGLIATLMDPMAAYAIMPDGETRLPGASASHLMEILRGGRGQSGGEKFAFASFLFGHNTRVAILSMASGILACVPTVFLVLYNGLILGAFTATHSMAGIHGEYWAWVLPHAVPELTALVLMGGAGLHLGAAVVSPGRAARATALMEAGRNALTITVGAAVLLVLAAVIESYVRQSHMAQTGRLLVAGGGALLLAAYFWLGVLAERRVREGCGSGSTSTR